MIKLLDDVWEISVQMSVHTVYKYDGYCCTYRVENLVMYRLKDGISYNVHLTFF